MQDGDCKSRIETTAGQTDGVLWDVKTLRWIHIYHSDINGCVIDHESQQTELVVEQLRNDMELSTHNMGKVWLKVQNKPESRGASLED